MKKYLLTCFALAIAMYSLAQERTVSGKVSSADDGSPLPGVNVVVKGTTIGTVTDSDGNFKLTVSGDNQSLVFSFIGLQTQEVAIGDRTVVDVQLTLDVRQLTEVVVTAQGIEREQKSLGFATTTISAATLAEKPETDIGRALQGRTPGLQVLNNSGLAGSGSKINIRGISTMTQNTQPLWVVDGVPINTQSNDISSSFVDGFIAPTRFLDIDPNNVESITVLRGLSATTTYGSQGRNGVILVTTKAGAKMQSKFQGSVSQSYYMIEAFVPEFQNKWGNGFDGAYGEFFSNWGSLFDGTPTGVRHPYFEHAALFPEHPEFAQSGTDNGGYAPVAAPNNVADFFIKGHSATTSLNLGASNQYGNVNFSYSHLQEAGFIKFNNLQRDNFGFGGQTNLTDKLTLTASFNFARTDFQTPPSASGGGSNSYGGPHIFANLFYTPRNIDLTNWPWENPITHASVYYRNGNDMPNPYWTLHNARQTSLTNRFFSSSNIKYQITEWLGVAYRLGLDTYTEEQKYWANKGGTGYSSELTPGAYRSISSNNTLLDHSFLVSITKQVSDDIDITGLLGYNFRDNQYTQQGLESLGQVVYGLLEHRNFTSTLPRDFRGSNLNYQVNSSIQGAYFEASLGFKDFVYLDLKGRNDWSSTLEKEHRSQFYPGASVAFIPTVAFPGFATETLEFLKLRVAYGTSAAFPGAYTTRPSLSLNSQARVDAIGNVVTSSLPSLLANPNLDPEVLKETEFGIETRLLQNKLRLDVSYYNRVADGQIVERSLDPSTGYNSSFINAGKIVNNGIEGSLWITPVKRGDFAVELGVNYTRNRNKVEDLPEGSTEILIAGFSNLGNFAIEGKPLNVIQGTFVERSPDGDLIVNESGDYKQANDIGIIADPNPEWLGSAMLNVSWKGISLGMQWDYVHGGQMYSFAAATMIARGVAKELEVFDPTLPLILPGVREVFDENGDVVGYKTNDIPLTTSGVFFTNTIIGGSPSDRGVYDATRVRFREISLSYSVPASIASKVKLTGINISLLGSNMWFRAINAPKYAKADFDRTPFGTGNGSGFDYLSGPSSRRYGFNVKLTF